LNIVALSMIGNEADVVECFVRHTLTVVDRLVVILHRSVDGTAQILNALREEGLPVQIEHARFAGFNQGAELTHAANLQFALAEAEHRVEFIVLLDADEFLKLPSRDYLYRALPAVPPGYYAASRWQNYLPMPGDDLSNAHTLRAITHCRQDESEIYYKVILGPAFARDQAMLLEGSHCVMRNTEEGLVGTPLIELKAIRLGHFPVRSAFQMARKARIGEMAKRLQTGARIAGLGEHWQGLREQVDKIGGDSFESLRAIAFHYPQTRSADVAIDEQAIVHSPIPSSFDLRYAHLIRYDLKEILRDWAGEGPAS
jgi:Glycosyl transferase family 2